MTCNTTIESADKPKLQFPYPSVVATVYFFLLIIKLLFRFKEKKGEQTIWKK